MAYLYFLLTALIILPILGLIYAYAIWYIPIPYINFFITAIFGVATGVAIGFIVINLGKVRSPLWAGIFLVLGAMTALYFHWAVWVDLAFNVSGTMGTDRIGIATSNVKFGEVFNLILNPAALFESMSLINEVGVWGIKGGTVKGGFLSFIWIVEIVLTVGAALFTGISQSGKPFCEFEGKWVEETDLAPTGLIMDAPAFASALDRGDLEALGTMVTPAGDIKTEHHSTMTVYDNASGENFVTVTNKVASKNSKGEIDFKDEAVTRYLKVSQLVMDKLRGKA
jgi:hypothetical protein